MRFFIIAHILVFLFGVYGCNISDREKPPPAPDQPKTEVKIGVIGPLEGDDKKWGENGLAGIRTAQTLVNQTSANHVFKLEVKDDRNDPDLAGEALTAFAEEPGVVAVLLLSNSKVALKLASVADHLRIPIFALMSTHPNITDNNSYMSQLLFDNNAQAKVTALYVRDELLLDQVGVIVDRDNPHSSYLAEEFIRVFDSVGGVVVEVPYYANETLFEERLKGLKNNDIELIYLPLEAPKVVVTAKILDKIQFKPVLMGSDGLQANLLLNFPDSLQLVDGMLAPDPYSSDQVPTPFGRKLSALFQEDFDIEGTVLAAMGAEGGAVLFSAVKRCYGNVTRECVGRKLRSTEDFIGYLDIISIGSDGKAERPIYMNRSEGINLKKIVKIN